MIGVRNVDLGGWLLVPANTTIEEGWELVERVAEHNGGTHRMGRNLRSLLHRVGFVRCEASASYECCGTVETTQARAEIAARRIETSPLFQQSLDLGWADGPTLEKLAAAWREWGQQPDAFLAWAWCEAVGWKVGESEAP